MNKIKKMFLLIVTMLVTMALVFAFVACNDRGNNDLFDDPIPEVTLDGKISPEMQALASGIKNDIALFCGYMITDFSNGVKGDVAIEYSDNYGSDTVYILLSYSMTDPESGKTVFCGRYCYDSEESARSAYEDMLNYVDDDEYVLSGNEIMRNRALYEKIVGANLKPHVTDEFDKQELDFLNAHIYEPAPENGYKVFGAGFDSECDAWQLMGSTLYSDSNITVTVGLISVLAMEADYEFDYEQAQKTFAENYMSGSYIKFYEDKGLIEFRAKIDHEE